jgi:proliferating cell nuclear antigen
MRSSDEVSLEPKPPEPPKPAMTAFAEIPAAALKPFVALVDAVASIVKVVVTRDGWSVRAVDPAHIELIDISLAWAAFRDARIGWVDDKGTGPLDRVEFGVDFKDLKDVLKAVKKEDVRLEYRGGEKASLSVSWGGKTRTLACVDLAGIADPKVPRLDLPVELRIAAKALYEAAKGAEGVASYVALEANRSEGTLVAWGGKPDVDAGLYRETFGPETVEYVAGPHGETHRSMFPVAGDGQLLPVLKALKDQVLTVRMGTDLPLRIEWEVGTSKGVYLIAPRIEDR